MTSGELVTIPYGSAVPVGPDATESVTVVLLPTVSGVAVPGKVVLEGGMSSAVAVSVEEVLVTTLDATVLGAVVSSTGVVLVGTVKDASLPLRLVVSPMLVEFAYGPSPLVGAVRARPQYQKELSAVPTWH